VPPPDNGGVSEQTTRPPQAPVPPRRKSFAEQSYGDLVRSMVMLLLLIGVIWLVGSFFTAEDEERPVRQVSYAEQLHTARDLADYRVLAPRGLGAAWTATSVDLQSSGGTVRWHLGFLTPQQEYVGLEQSDVEPEEVAAGYVGDLRRVGVTRVGGERWQVYDGETDTALVRRQGEVVTIVVGTASRDVLTTFAASLS
jgi:hypothetical protein